jgi:glucose-6-phosphate isomerase
VRSYWRLGASSAAATQAAESLAAGRFVERIDRHDATLWKDDAAHARVIESSLGWLDLPETMRERTPEIRAFAAEVHRDGVRDVVLCGMGGSSLAPEVFASTLSRRGWPVLRVLDSTCPGQIRRLESEIDLSRTLFLIASKSGSTLETQCHFRYFFEKVGRLGGKSPGSRFVAITDPGSPLERLAKEHGFRRVFANFPDIGGRYSALSYFGLVPAALAGADVDRLLSRARGAARACRAPGADNPGVRLGAALAALARGGRDKATIACSPEIGSFGTWLEQLVAESTGKEGKGIVPVESERLGAAETYGVDRFFLYERIDDTRDASPDQALDRLAGAGHPVAAFALRDRFDLGARMYLWEFAVAAAGAVLGIDAFDQPNVQESKDNTRDVLSELVRTGRLPGGEPEMRRDGLEIFEGASKLLACARRGRDYVALQVFARRGADTVGFWEDVREKVRRETGCATTLGFGPRFLHSTGQLHKGGPPEGVFLQFVERAEEDVAIPGESYGFGAFLEAQAYGDERSLRSRDARFSKVRFPGDVTKGDRRRAITAFAEKSCGGRA